MFYLAYHLHWSWRDILALTPAERRDYVMLLSQRIEAENHAISAL